MAARQDQTQMIAIIVCAILILILSIVAYLGWSAAAKETARADDLTQRVSDAEGAARDRTTEAQEMGAMIGFDAGTPFADIAEAFKTDQERFMAEYEEGARSYRNVLDFAKAENQKIAEQENVAKAQVKKLEQDLIALKAEWERQLGEERAKADGAKQDLAAERNRFEREREAIDKQKRQLAQTLARKEEEFNKKVTDAESAREAVQLESDNKNRTIETLQAERKTEAPTSEVADGRVTYVNQANQTVWIDLGEADSLRRQVTFSVFASDLSDAAKAEKKASLEVTRILGDHVAEAKVTVDDPRDPILPGDRIYSQIWARGKALRFGLTGFIDLEGDGVSDLQRAKDLIALNGGVVDVSLEDDGTTDGEMTVSTRYLVLGDSPDQPSKSAYREGYQKMSKEAATLGVETITLVDFLNRMGYRPAEETFRFTGGASRPAGAGGGGRPTSYRFSP